MRIDKAIEYLKEDLLSQHRFAPLRVSEAKQLGIEALERLKEIRQSAYLSNITKLPGETET